ncbi:MAG: hypothetical protein H0V53_06035 [Rubrobacter sp.]|nr:hypothetical protein [Rubrobacter sp.]
MLREACRTAPGDAVRLEVVGALARDLQAELEALSQPESGSSAFSLVETALRCADLANLAACAVPEFPEPAASEAAAAAHLAAGAAQALRVAAEAATESQGQLRDHLRRDARGAGWRAGLAARQVNEFLEDRG